MSMARWLVYFVTILTCGSAAAGAWNTWQPFKPVKQNVAAAGASSGPSNYEEENDDPNVVLLYKMDEASGDIVDEVSGITLADTGSGFTYSATLSDLFADVSPGITFNGSGHFAKGSSCPTVAPGTGDYKLEWYFATSETWYIYQWGFNSSSYQGMEAYFRFASPNFVMYVEAVSSGAQTYNVTLDQSYADGLPHLAEFVWDRDGNMDLLIDNVSQGPAASTLNGTKTIACSDIEIGAAHNSTSERMNGSIYALRASQNITNNLFGPGD